MTTHPAIDNLDRRIIAVTQSGLPLVSDPYGAVAAEIGVDAADVRERMQKMLDAGLIRRIGVVPNHYALGMKANGMSVWDVDDQLVDALGKQVGALDFVSHCYCRPRHRPHWPYNLFAMVHGNTRDEVFEKAGAIERLLGPAARSHDVLFSTRILKKTGLRIAASKED